MDDPRPLRSPVADSHPAQSGETVGNIRILGSQFRINYLEAHPQRSPPDPYHKVMPITIQQNVKLEDLTIFVSFRNDFRADEVKRLKL